MQQTTRLKLTELNNHLICVLCGGYFVNATAIIECHHSFCRSCIVRHLEKKKTCPTCENVVHKTRPLLNLRPDRTLQTLVYKLVPGLYQNEMQRRRKFYYANPTSVPLSGEDRGEMEDSHLIYTEDEKISLCLQHCDRFPSVHLPSDMAIDKIPKTEDTPHKRHLLCPALVTIGHLKKFVRHKFDLTACYQVEIFHTRDSLKDACTLMDVANIYSWKRVEPLRLYYIVFDKTQLSLEMLPEPTDKPIITTTIRLPTQKHERKRKNTTTKSPKNNLVKSRRFKPPAVRSPKSQHDDTKPKARKKYKKRAKVNIPEQGVDSKAKSDSVTGGINDNMPHTDTSTLGDKEEEQPLSMLKGILNDKKVERNQEMDKQSALSPEDTVVQLDTRLSDEDLDDAKSSISDVTIICGDYDNDSASSSNKVVPEVLNNGSKNVDMCSSHDSGVAQNETTSEYFAKVNGKTNNSKQWPEGAEPPAMDQAKDNKQGALAVRGPKNKKNRVNKGDSVKSPIKNKPKCAKDNASKGNKVLDKDISALEKDNQTIISPVKPYTKDKQTGGHTEAKCECSDLPITETQNKVKAPSDGHVVVPVTTGPQTTEVKSNRTESPDGDVEVIEITEKAIDLVNQPDLVRSSQVLPTATTCNCAQKKGSDVQYAQKSVRPKEDAAPVKTRIEVVTRAADTSNPQLDSAVIEKDTTPEKVVPTVSTVAMDTQPASTEEEAHELANRASPSSSVCSLATVQSDNANEPPCPSPLSDSASTEKPSKLAVPNKAPGQNSITRARKLSGPVRDKAKSINSIIKRIEERNQGLQNSKRPEQSPAHPGISPSRNITPPAPVTPTSCSPHTTRVSTESPSPVHSTVPRNYSPILSQTKMTASPPQQHIQQLLRQNNIPIGLAGLTPGRGLKRVQPLSGSRGRGAKRAQSAGHSGQDTTPIKRLRQMCNGFVGSPNGVKQTSNRHPNFTSNKPQVAQRPQYVGVPRGSKSGVNVDPRVVMNQALAHVQAHANVHNNNNNTLERRPQPLSNPNYSYQKPSDHYAPVPTAAHAHTNGQHVSPGSTGVAINGGRSPRSNVHPAHNNYKPYQRDYVAVNPRANGYDEPLELTTKPSRDRKRAEDHVHGHVGRGRGRGTFLKIPSLVKP